MSVMTPRQCFVALAALSCFVFASHAKAQNNTQRGATFGGLAGAVAGGLIGDHNDKAGAGAGIGAVVGAVAGGLLGNAADKDAQLARQQQYYQQQQHMAYQQQQQAVQMQSAVTLQDVISMSRSGLSDQVITNQIRQRGYIGTIAVSDIIALHQQGVSENVITSIQTIANNPQIVARPPQYSPQTHVIQREIVQPAPVIIHEPIIVHERVYPSYPRPSYHRGPSRSHIHMRF
ncbi:glycine zipper domain-containing protein [Stieleria varia]|uniref:YMGG-like Gly-zipper domain-containing protein n=1 Tax=Stieleria varia TaxID=2528005 RepID=A0A5C6B559_9BACT|nr:glycine zipper domain-containing protein [Stieleria varia]TWU05604.1 hypothetical protein Pla52n_13190 [Stieleria varia]